MSCDSMDVSIVSPSGTEADKILAMGLSHDESLIVAGKLSDPLLASAVVQELNKRNEKNQMDQIDRNNEEKYAKAVLVSNDGNSFTGPLIFSTKNRGLLRNLELATDNEEYFLYGLKHNDEIFNHQLQLTIEYSSDSIRNYFGANYCDEWGRCDGESIEVDLISSSASACTSSDCIYKEVMEVSLNDDFLIKAKDKGFTLIFKSKKANNKIEVPQPYLKGYLSIAK